MSSPTEFIQACIEGRVFVYCEGCASAKNYNAVEHLGIVEHPAYWGTEPWWHDQRIFRCPDCGSQQQSAIHLNE